MQLLIEISIFLLVLVLLQYIVSIKTRKNDRPKTASSKQIEKFKNGILGFFIFACLSFILIYFSLFLFHRIAGFEYFLFVESISLILPALVLGYVLSFLQNNKSDEQEVEKNKTKRIKKIMKVGLTLVLVAFLLFVDFSHYLRLDKRYLYFKVSNEPEKVIPLSSILEIKESENLHFTIYCQDLEIKTDKLGGDIQAFISELKRKKKELNK